MKRLWALVDTLPPDRRPALLRGDVGYGNDATMCEAEARGIPYLFKIKRSRNIQKLFKILSGGKGWKDCGSGWEALEQRVKLDGWQRRRRVLFIRRPAEKKVETVEPKKTGRKPRVPGGPAGDSGLTGRKIIVDTYGGMAAHGGGAFSGKDPSKVDRSAAYYARYAAKNIVAAGLAHRCQIQVAYAIGVDKPVSFCVKTFGTAAPGVTNAALEKLLLSGKVFDFRPWALIRDLKLLAPKGWSYRDTASYGHFGRAIFPWEKTDKVKVLKSLFFK